MDTSGLPFRKPAPRDKRVRASTTRHRREKRTKREVENAIKSETRALVFHLDPRCVVCFCEPSVDDEMHEVVPRSKTRGQPPECRFNRRICCRLCRQCHQSVTGNRIAMALVDWRGMDGALAFQLMFQRSARKAWLYRRGPAGAIGSQVEATGIVYRGTWTPERG